MDRVMRWAFAVILIGYGTALLRNPRVWREFEADRAMFAADTKRWRNTSDTSMRVVGTILVLAGLILSVSFVLWPDTMLETGGAKVPDSLPSRH